MATRDGLSIDKWNPTTMRVKTSIASVSQGRTPMASRVVSSTRKTINFRVVDLHDLQGAAKRRIGPAPAFVAFTPLLSLRLSAATRRSIRSTRALIVRRSGGGSSARPHLALTCSIK